MSANTLDLQSTVAGPHTLDIFVTGNGLTDPLGLNNAMSGFTAVSLSNGWTANLSTLLDTANGNFSGALLDSISFVGNGVSTFANNQTTAANFGTGPFSLTAHFQIVTTGTGQANTGIQIAAGPVPAVGAGLPGVIAGFGALYAGARSGGRRRSQAGSTGWLRRKREP